MKASLTRRVRSMAWCRSAIRRAARPGINVAARVHALFAEAGLFGRHVFERANHRAAGGDERALGERFVDGFGDTEVDDFENGLPSVMPTRTLEGLMSRWMMPF